MKDRIKQLNTEIQKLTSDAKTLYEDMDRKSEKGVKDYNGRIVTGKQIGRAHV